MARPKSPLISPRAVFELALKIIDAEGVGALSTRRLGQELGVNGTSLYHHFKTMDEIVAGAAALAFKDVDTPVDPEADWRTWLPENVLRTRRILLAHPNLIPVLSDRRRLGIGEKAQNETVERLIAEGVPQPAVMPLMLSLELFAIGSALHETQNAAAASDRDPPGTYPALEKARADSALVGEQLLEVIIDSVIEAVISAVPAKRKRSTTRSSKPSSKPSSQPGKKPTSSKTSTAG
jgi:AcrR family transcriptional regulator